MKKKLFIDTNVVIDLLTERDEHYMPAAKIASLCDTGKVALVVSSLSIVTVNYILRKLESNEKAKVKIKNFLILCDIAGVDEKIVKQALSSRFKDFEDAVQYYSALSSESDLIISRNEKDFRLSEIPVLSPRDYLNSLE